MVFCFTASVAFTSANRRNQVVVALEQSRQSKVEWPTSIPQLSSQSNKIGEFGINAIFRWANQADRTAFINDMLAFAVGQFTPVAGSWYETHDCLHDADPPACTNYVRVVF